MFTTSVSCALSLPSSVIIPAPWGREGVVGYNLYFPFRAEHSMVSYLLHHPHAASCVGLCIDHHLVQKEASLSDEG